MAKKIHTVESMRNEAYWDHGNSFRVEIGRYNEPKLLTCQWVTSSLKESDNRFDFIFETRMVGEHEAIALLTRQKSLTPKPAKVKVAKDVVKSKKPKDSKIAGTVLTAKAPKAKKDKKPKK